MLDMHLRSAVQTSPAAALASSGIAGTDPGETGLYHCRNILYYYLKFEI